jgi:hypothetical protein
MPVDFFAIPCANPAGNCTVYSISCLANIPNSQFGITDEDGGDSTPARVDTLNPLIWDLTVTNSSGVDIKFKAVDWCVPIYRTGTYDLDNNARTAVQFSSDNFGKELIKRCEGFLQFDDKILFIEIKRRKNNASEWIEDARKKFEETILSFREHHPNLAQKIIKPILVNPIHTGVASSEMVQKRILKDKIGIEFIRQDIITI